MNPRLEAHARQLLRANTLLLSEAAGQRFRQLYATDNLPADTPLADFVDRMPVDRLELALDQVQRTLVRQPPTHAALAPDAVRPLVYLATPYSHPEHAVRVARFEAVNHAAGYLMNQGLKVFSPISHTHPIAEATGLPKGWEFWEAFDRAYLAHAHRLVVLKLPGWQESTGVTAEIKIARELGLAIEELAPEQVPGLNADGSLIEAKPSFEERVRCAILNEAKHWSGDARAAVHQALVAVSELAGAPLSIDDCYQAMRMQQAHCAPRG